MLSEDNIIRDLQAKSKGFIGDDAAVLPNLSNDKYIITKDLLTEDVHFRLKYFMPQDLAHKALHVNLSDLAAMGAEPLYILCGISMPNHLQEYASNFLSYLTICCQEVGVILIGGDTTSSSEKLFISITAIGKAQERNIKYISTARSDDLVCLAGNLGFAHLGFTTLENGFVTNTKYTDKFLHPQAKLKEGVWLGKHTCVTSMTDVSDGIYINLKRLCFASNKRGIIDIDLLQQHLEAEISLQIALRRGRRLWFAVYHKAKGFRKII